jgi:alpha-aminoadipate carrier protein LysW
MATCPDCDAQIDLEEEELEEGVLIKCEECGADLRVLGLDPLELEAVEEDEEEDEEEEPDADEEDGQGRWH